MKMPYREIDLNAGAACTLSRGKRRQIAPMPSPSQAQLNAASREYWVADATWSFAGDVEYADIVVGENRPGALSQIRRILRNRICLPSEAGAGF